MPCKVSSSPTRNERFYAEADSDIPNLAHKEAYEKAKILHRDISCGNILIDKNGRGLLIDWDMCKRLDNEHANKTRQSERTVHPFAMILAILYSLSCRSNVGNLAVHVCHAIDEEIATAHPRR